MCCGGGGGAPQQTTSTVTQSNLPEYARPYFEDLMRRTRTYTQEPYQTYQGQRLYDQSADTLQGYQGIRQLYDRGLGTLDQAMGTVTDATAGLMNQNIDPSMVATNRFGAADAAHYMSPYTDQVIDRAKQGIEQDYLRNRYRTNDEFVSAGAFGGSRHAVADYLQQEGMMDRMADVEAQLLDEAYRNAQGQFQYDTSAGLQAGIANQNAGLTADQLNLSRLNSAMAGGQGLGALEQMYQGLGNQRNQMLLQSGAGQEQYQQSGLDIGYQDFINQRDYPRQNLQLYSSILRGVPVSAQSEVINYAQPPNPFSQALGLGISGLGLYNMMSGS